MTKKQLQQKHLKFPSFYECMNLTRTAQRTGVQYIDLPEFMQLDAGRQTKDWKDASVLTQLACNATLPYRNLVDVFQRKYGQDPVVMIGSAYVMTTPYATYNETGEETIDREILSFPPSIKLQALVEHLYQKLPPDYSAVHIRFPDEYAGRNMNCQDDKIVQAYHNIFQQLSESSKGAKNVFVAKSHKHAKECLEQVYMKATTMAADTNINTNTNGTAITAYKNLALEQVITVDKLMEGDEVAQNLFDQIHLEKSTVYVLLDELLVGLAGLTLAMNSPFFGSTLQRMMQKRHDAGPKSVFYS